jgi:hypothetical protein
VSDTSPGPATPATREHDGAGSAPETARAGAGRRRAWWSAPAGAIGAVTGLAPHVLHHIGLLAGTALITGAGGTALFGILGLAASVPLLLRLHRRFATWWAPVIGLAVFALMFSVSAFIIGPAINSGAGAPPGGGQPTPSIDHSGHHG